MTSRNDPISSLDAHSPSQGTHAFQHALEPARDGRGGIHGDGIGFGLRLGVEPESGTSFDFVFDSMVGVASRGRLVLGGLLSPPQIVTFFS